MLADSRPVTLLARIALTTMLADCRPVTLLTLFAQTTVLADSRPVTLLAIIAPTTMLADSRPVTLLASIAHTTMFADSRPVTLLALIAPTTMLANCRPVTLLAILAPTTMLAKTRLSSNVITQLSPRRQIPAQRGQVKASLVDEPGGDVHRVPLHHLPFRGHGKLKNDVATVVRGGVRFAERVELKASLAHQDGEILVVRALQDVVELGWIFGEKSRSTLCDAKKPTESLREHSVRLHELGVHFA